MKESDYPESDYFYLPIEKKLAIKYLHLNPKSEDAEDFVIDINQIIDKVFDAAYVRSQKMAIPQQEKQPEPQQYGFEAPYLKCQLDEDSKRSYH